MAEVETFQCCRCGVTYSQAALSERYSTEEYPMCIHCANETKPKGMTPQEKAALQTVLDCVLLNFWAGQVMSFRLGDKSTRHEVADLAFDQAEAMLAASKQRGYADVATIEAAFNAAKGGK